MKITEKIIRYLDNKSLTLSTAESITGGLIASKLVEISGASSVFLGSIVSYSYDIKSKLLDVDIDYLNEHGAINEYTAKQMAIGAIKSMGTDFVLAITGSAGPTSEKDVPVGRVYIAVAKNNKSYGIEVLVEKHIFSGKRNEIREKCSKFSLEVLYNFIVSKTK